MIWVVAAAISALSGHPIGCEGDMDYLHQVAVEVTSASRVGPNDEIAGHGRNTTGFALRVPGGTRTYYPAFWVRDAAMMLGSDLIPEPEVEGWIRVIAATQPGPAGLSFAHGLHVPGYSIPDHITLAGRACWYPGAYLEQGDGSYGILPPADDAFYFIQMVAEQRRLAGNSDFYNAKVKTGWGDQPLRAVCERAFESVASDPTTGLVVCDQHETRVDWGFCDSVRKTGSCLMPSCLRWAAALQLSGLAGLAGDPQTHSRYAAVAKQIADHVASTFYLKLDKDVGMLASATDLGRQDDIWASAFAVWIGILPPEIETNVRRHLLDLYHGGGITVAGQVRQLPRGDYWVKSSTEHEKYQNGGFWGVPVGWLIEAMDPSDRNAAVELFDAYVADLKAHRGDGAPFEWIGRADATRVNPNYAASVAAPYVTLSQSGWK